MYLYPLNVLTIWSTECKFSRSKNLFVICNLHAAQDGPADMSVCQSISPAVRPSVSPFAVVVVSLANSCHWGNSSSFRCGSSWNALWYVQPRSSSRGLFSIRSLMCQKCFKCFSKKKNQIYNKKPNWNLQTIRGLASEKKKYERIKLKSFFTARFSYFVAMCT